MAVVQFHKVTLKAESCTRANGWACVGNPATKRLEVWLRAKQF